MGIPCFGRPDERIFEVQDEGVVMERCYALPLRGFDLDSIVKGEAEAMTEMPYYRRRLYRKRLVVLAGCWPLIDVAKVYRAIYVADCEGCFDDQWCPSCDPIFPLVVRYLLYGNIYA